MKDHTVRFASLSSALEIPGITAENAEEALVTSVLLIRNSFQKGTGINIGYVTTATLKCRINR